MKYEYDDYKKTYRFNYEQVEAGTGLTWST